MTSLRTSSSIDGVAPGMQGRGSVVYQGTGPAPSVLSPPGSVQALPESLTQPLQLIRVGFIGAGGVNFGLGPGVFAWDHSTRVERYAGVVVVGIADPLQSRREFVLSQRRLLTNSPHVWADTQLFSDWRQMVDEVKPDCVFVGLPPIVHGNMKSPVELELARRNIHMFIEKPITCVPPEDLSDFHQQLVTEAAQRQLIISVGYMFRYHRAVQEAKMLIHLYGPPKLFRALYAATYNTTDKLFWWQKSASGGHIIEQATHFCDLARFFCGEVQLSTVTGNCIGANERAGKLKHCPVDESKIVPDDRVPRLTCASWRFASGAMGTLTHVALLHGNKYQAELEIWGDGYYIKLRDPYTKATLHFRPPLSEEETVITIDDDPYMTEDEVFLNSCKASKHTPLILSSYEDAFKTYEFTWAVKRATEPNVGDRDVPTPATGAVAAQ